jgi:hypothetical protein
VLALRENENDEPIVRGLLVALKAQSGHSKRSGFEQSIEPDGLG